MFHRGLGATLTAVLLAAATAPAVMAADGKVVLAPAAIELPAKLGPLRLTGEPHKYEPAALGVSYQFSGRGMSLTVYVYDANVKDIPDGGDSVQVCEQVEEAKDGVLQAKYPNTVLTREQMVRLSPAGNAPLAREARYELEREGQPTISYIWVTAVSRNFVKLRFSFSKQLADEELDARRAILEALGEAIGPYLAPLAADAEKGGTTMNLSMGMDDSDMGASMMYAVSLSSMVEETPALVPVCGGTLVPSFEVELAALRSLETMSGEGLDSKFGKRLAAIGKAGFLEEFVWVDMHRDEWGAAEPEGLDTAGYAQWRKKKLKRFQRPNLGSVTLSKPRPIPVVGL